MAETGSQRHPPDTRPLGRIGGGDLPTITVDPKNENVVYSCSTVFWRTEDGGLTWSAVRGAPGGDDYQKSWVNPNNPNIILLVSDQGAVVSANRGESWSNWYTQPTAAMYHVTADNAFPYRLCSGQQDSGSACVESRGMDGEITFHDWHPVGIEEYGEAAPDPKNPDLVYGGKVSLYNRVTGQKAQVGPPLQDAEDGTRRTRRRCGDRKKPPARTVRTQPLIWSPKDPNLLFYATAGVWKTANGGHSWTAISGDLTRQTWEVPANAGKYASTVTPAPLGSITALAPSPLDVNVLWAGTGDGLLQVTTDGGAKWTNVTPPQIKAWTRIFNMEAGHFDTKTAYAAANTLRLDDMNPHFWRTHDGGKTWTEIDNGIAPRRGRQLHPRRSAQEGSALRRHRHPDLGLLRRWRPLEFAAAQHAGHLGARHRSQGRRLLHVLRPGGRHARPRLLDSRRRDPAAPGRRGRRRIQRLAVQALRSGSSCAIGAPCCMLA